MNRSEHKTIADFGEQWSRYTDNDGYYGSTELLADLLGPLLSLTELRGARVADIGSGTGRIVRMLLDAGVRHVTAIEPSTAFTVLKGNTWDVADRIEYLHVTGESVPKDREFDFVFAIGVLHHISEPGPVVRAAFEALRSGGRMLVWLYGKEGNLLYLRVALRLRRVTTRLPHWALSLLCHALNALLSFYITACRWLPLPMCTYMNQYLSKLTFRQRHLAIYDQLNPHEATYYTGEQAGKLLSDAGFTDVRLYHRHGYSWTVIGTKAPA